MHFDVGHLHGNRILHLSFASPNNERTIESTIYMLANRTVISIYQSSYLWYDKIIIGATFRFFFFFFYIKKDMEGKMGSFNTLLTNWASVRS